MYLYSNVKRRALAGGIIKLPNKNENKATTKAESINGRNIRLKLTPLVKIATISV